MVHVFYYLNGLNGEIGDLLILPRSHDLVAQRDLRMLGTADLEGSLCFDDLEPGSAVIAHSAVWHARRPRPGGRERPRYFIDVSYCQNGVLWPAYDATGGINARALEAGLDRNGRYAFLYDSSQFYDHRAVSGRFEEINRGSLVTRLVPPPNGVSQPARRNPEPAVLIARLCDRPGCCRSGSGGAVLPVLPRKTPQARCGARHRAHARTAARQLS